jgi:hypothetical protein
MGTVERPFVQRNIPITTTQPIIEDALTCAYCQQVGHEFNNYPFVDDKLKRLMKEKLKTFLQLVVLSTSTTHVGACTYTTNPNTTKFGYQPNTS